jgi:hypothetical protein
MKNLIRMSEPKPSITWRGHRTKDVHRLALNLQTVEASKSASPAIVEGRSFFEA